MDTRIVNLIELLLDSDKSLDDLSQKLDVSTRTVRNRIHQANDGLQGIATIEIGRNGIVHLAVFDRNALDERRSLAARHAVPDTTDDRIRYLLNDLLTRNDWVTLDNLAEVLYVSRGTISSVLRDVEERLNRFGLALERKPRYGIRVTGPEMARRLCLASVAVNNRGIAWSDYIQDALKRSAACVSAVLDESGFRISALTYQNLLVHIAVAVERIRQGCYMPLEGDQLSRIREVPEYRVARDLASRIEREFEVKLPEAEVAYIAIHLSGRQKINPSTDADSNVVVISDEVLSVLKKMLDRIWDSYRFDFRNDIELRMNLARHIGPLAVRLRYHLNAENPLLGDIKSNYPLAYSMACDASTVLKETYGTMPSDDEIGYIALAFALALDRLRSRVKKNILIVCASGMGSAKLLEHQYRDAFGPYLGAIKTCDALEVDQVDMTDIDFVFTTVPLQAELSAPVYLIKGFLDDRDISTVRRALRYNEADDMFARVFSPRLLLTHMECSSKAEVIDTLCDVVERECGVPDRFRKLVWAREKAAPTAFGNLIAMPHPLRAVSENTFIAVGLLDKPVSWDGNDVQAVFLISVAATGDPQLQSIYRALSRLFLDPVAIHNLIADQRISTLFEMLRSCDDDTERES